MNKLRYVFLLLVSSLLWAQTPKPTSISPADRTVVRDHTPVFSWTSISGATMYEMTVSRRTNGSTGSFITWFTEQLTGTSLDAAEYGYAFPNTYTSGNTAYAWRVRALKNGVWSGWTLFNYLNVDTPPTQSSPVDRIDIPDHTPTLVWDAAPGATGYIIEIARRTGGSTGGFYTWITQKVSDPYFDAARHGYDFPNTSTIDNSGYAWRVKTLTGTNTSPVSLYSYFDVNSQDNSCAYPNPNNNPASLPGDITTQPGAVDSTNHLPYYRVGQSRWMEMDVVTDPALLANAYQTAYDNAVDTLIRRGGGTSGYSYFRSANYFLSVLDDSVFYINFLRGWLNGLKSSDPAYAEVFCPGEFDANNPEFLVNPLDAVLSATEETNLRFKTPADPSDPGNLPGPFVDGSNIWDIRDRKEAFLYDAEGKPLIPASFRGPEGYAMNPGSEIANSALVGNLKAYAGTEAIGAGETNPQSLLPLGIGQYGAIFFDLWSPDWSARTASDNVVGVVNGGVYRMTADCTSTNPTHCLEEIDQSDWLAMTGQRFDAIAEGLPNTRLHLNLGPRVEAYTPVVLNAMGGWQLDGVMVEHWTHDVTVSNSTFSYALSSTSKLRERLEFVDALHNELDPDVEIIILDLVPPPAGITDTTNNTTDEFVKRAFLSYGMAELVRDNAVLYSMEVDSLTQWTPRPHQMKHFGEARLNEPTGNRTEPLTNLYRREFSNGTLLVNVGDTDITYTLDLNGKKHLYRYDYDERVVINAPTSIKSFGTPYTVTVRAKSTVILADN